MFFDCSWSLQSISPKLALTGILLLCPYPWQEHQREKLEWTRSFYNEQESKLKQQYLQRAEIVPQIRIAILNALGTSFFSGDCCSAISQIQSNIKMFFLVWIQKNAAVWMFTILLCKYFLPFSFVQYLTNPS